MIAHDVEDPLVNDEIVEITLEAHHVRFTLTKSIVQVGAPFVVSSLGRPSMAVDPAAKSGELNHLWSLVGGVVKAVQWNGAIRISLDGERTIEIGASMGQPRGTIMGRNDMTVEDF